MSSVEMDFLTELKEALSKIGQNQIQQQEASDDNGSSTRRTGGIVSGRTQPLSSATTSAAGANCADTNAESVAVDAGKKTTAVAPDYETKEMTNESKDGRRYNVSKGKKERSITIHYRV